MSSVAGGRRRLIILIVLVVMTLDAATRVVRRRGLRDIAMAVVRSRSVSSGGVYQNILFLRHSVGCNLIEHGTVGELFSEQRYDFCDHECSRIGVTASDRTRASFHCAVSDDNTNPDGLTPVFEQPVYGLAVNTLSGLLKLEVTALKSCFPVNDIGSVRQLETYMTCYDNIRDVIGRHKDRTFVFVTPPSLTPAATGASTASRARALSDWLSSPEYLAHHPSGGTAHRRGETSSYQDVPRNRKS